MGVAKMRRASTRVFTRRTSVVVLSSVVALLSLSPVSSTAAESAKSQTKTRFGTKTHRSPPPSAPDYPPHPPLVPNAPQYPPWPEYPPTPEHPGYPQYPHPPHAPSPPPRPPPAPWPPWPPHGPPPPRDPPSPASPMSPPPPPPPPPKPVSTVLTVLFVAVCAASVFFGARLAFFDGGGETFFEFWRRKMSRLSRGSRDDAYVALAGSVEEGDDGGAPVRGESNESGSLDDFADLRDYRGAAPIETPRVYEDDYLDAESSDADSNRSGDGDGPLLLSPAAAAAKRKENAARGSNREPELRGGDGFTDAARVQRPRLVTRTVPLSAREWRDDVVGSL